MTCFEFTLYVREQRRATPVLVPLTNRIGQMKILRNAMAFVSVPLVALALLTAANSSDEDTAAQQSTDTEGVETAIFAGGCFWCVESDFDQVPGVLETVSGYSGGETTRPTYKNHHQGRHREVVQITYDPQQVSYEELLHVFWRSIDPTDAGGQFCDRGHSYTTAVYSMDAAQQQAAVKSLETINEQALVKQPIVTAIEPAAEFWRAEEYHQDYYMKNPLRYKYYRAACGRDARVKKVWGDEAYSGLAKAG